MKRFLFFILSLSIIACQSEQQLSNTAKSNDVEQRRKDSMEIVYAKAKRENDSIMIVQRKQDAKIAYGKIMFGMTRKEYNKVARSKQKIGDYEYSFYPIFDNKGKLYKLEISGSSLMADEFDTSIKYHWQNLRDIIRDKYYASDRGNGEYPKFFEVDKGYYRWSDTWNIDTKRIDLGVTQSDYKYYAVALITHKPTEEELNTEAHQKSKKDKSKAADNF